MWASFKEHTSINTLILLKIKTSLVLFFKFMFHSYICLSIKAEETLSALGLFSTSFQDGGCHVPAHDSPKERIQIRCAKNQLTISDLIFLEPQYKYILSWPLYLFVFHEKVD